MPRIEDYKDFVKYVNNMRKMLPTEFNGRKVIVTHENTVKGRSLRIQHEICFDGYQLSDVYKKWSDEKQEAFNDVWSIYCNTKDAHDFGIRSHNVYGFTASFETENMIIFYTLKTEYIIFLSKY